MVGFCCNHRLRSERKIVFMVWCLCSCFGFLRHFEPALFVCITKKCTNPRIRQSLFDVGLQRNALTGIQFGCEISGPSDDGHSIIPQSLSQAKPKWCNENLEPFPERCFEILATVTSCLVFPRNLEA